MRKWTAFLGIFCLLTSIAGCGGGSDEPTHKNVASDSAAKAPAVKKPAAKADSKSDKKAKSAKAEETKKEEEKVANAEAAKSETGPQAKMKRVGFSGTGKAKSDLKEGANKSSKRNGRRRLGRRRREEAEEKREQLEAKQKKDLAAATSSGEPVQPTAPRQFILRQSAPEFAQQKGLSFIAFSNDGSQMATFGGDEQEVKIWDWKGGKLVMKGIAVKGFAHQLAISNNHKYVSAIVEGETTEGLVWEIATGSEIVRHPLNYSDADDVPSSNAGFSADNSFALFSTKSAVTLIDMETKNAKHLNEKDLNLPFRHQFNDVACSPTDPDLVAIAVGGTTRAKVQLYKFEQKTLEQRLGVPMRQGATREILFSSDGKSMVATQEKGGFYVWDTSSWSTSNSLPVGKIEYMRVSPDGTFVAGRDAETQKFVVLDVNNGHLVEVDEGVKPSDFAIAPNGLLAIASFEGPLQFVDPATGKIEPNGMMQLRGESTEVVAATADGGGGVAAAGPSTVSTPEEALFVFSGRLLERIQIRLAGSPGFGNLGLQTGVPETLDADSGDERRSRRSRRDDDDDERRGLGRNRNRGQNQTKKIAPPKKKEPKVKKAPLIKTGDLKKKKGGKPRMFGGFGGGRGGRGGK